MKGPPVKQTNAAGERFRGQVFGGCGEQERDRRDNGQSPNEQLTINNAQLTAAAGDIGWQILVTWGNGHVTVKK